MALVQRKTLELVVPTRTTRRNLDDNRRISLTKQRQVTPKQITSQSPTLKIHQVFERSPPSGHDVVSWSSLIARYCQTGQLVEAVRAFTAMRCANIEPNHITMVILLTACATSDRSTPHLGDLGSLIHGYVCKLGDQMHNVVLGTALVSMYAKSHRAEIARQVFDRMPLKNYVSWNAMVDGYMRNGKIEAAVSLFDRMPKRDKVSWTAMICGFEKNGQFEQALELFREMQLSDVETDYVTIIAVLCACANLGALGQGLWIHRYSLGRNFCHIVRWNNALIDMYARCGRIDHARQVFDGMPQRSLVSWNSMIVGFAINGFAQDALQHFSMMEGEGFKPNDVSFTGALTACSHAGLVEEGLRYFDIMSRIYAISPRVEHYGCAVDLLSRAGRLREAMCMVESMPMKPNAVVLGSLLGACRIHGDLDLAESLMGFLVELEPDCDSNYVLLSNMYAAVGRWEGAGKVRTAMKSLGIKKMPGFSAIELDCSVHEFVAGDKSHPRSKDIYAMLDLLSHDLEFKLHDGSLHLHRFPGHGRD